MNEQFERCLYQSGLTAQGCWDQLDDYAKDAIEKFARLIVAECTAKLHAMNADVDGRHNYYAHAAVRLNEHFGE